MGVANSELLWCLHLTARRPSRCISGNSPVSGVTPRLQRGVGRPDLVAASVK